MHSDYKTRLTALSDKLTDVVLEEADPDNWPGAGKEITKHTKQERGDGAKHGDYIRNIHNAPPNLTPRSNFRKILLISDHDKL